MFLFWCDDVVVVVVHSSWECEPNCGKIYDKRWSHQCTMLLLLLADGAQRYRNGCTGFDFMFDFDFQCPTATAREDFIVNLLRWWSGDDANTSAHTCSFGKWLKNVCEMPSKKSMHCIRLRYRLWLPECVCLCVLTFTFFICQWRLRRCRWIDYLTSLKHRCSVFTAVHLPMTSHQPRGNTLIRG